MENNNEIDQAVSYCSVTFVRYPVLILAIVLLKSQRTDKLAVLAKKYIASCPADNRARV
jgi:hypothetical protein